MNERIIIDSSIQRTIRACSKAGRGGAERAALQTEFYDGWIVRGTRVPVHRIIGSLAGGATPEEVCEEYGIIGAQSAL